MTPQNQCFEFGPYQLDLTRRVLSCDGETISLTPKATEILIKLIAKAGQVVEKDQLLKEVWPNTFVEEANLSQNIFTLRKALRDDRNEPKYIETIAKRGYRFVGTVRGLNPTVSNSRHVIADSSNVIAVLPFVNKTAAADIEHLAEGLTDNLINNLSRIPKLRVMSKSALLRFKIKDVDPHEVGRQLGVNAVLLGTINSRSSGLSIAAELVDVATGWQLWGEVFDGQAEDLRQVEEVVTKQLLASLTPKLTNGDERKSSARYTENTEAYQAYLEGRHHWSKFTKAGIETAILYFRKAIEIDPKYALAYSAIIDCYLRLTTNYLPPEDQLNDSSEVAISERIRLRFEWDLKAAERELHRAADLKTEYPAAHQWFFAYWTCKQLYEMSLVSSEQPDHSQRQPICAEFCDGIPVQIASLELTPSEQVQVLCVLVREQIDIGNYEAGRKLLEPWWSFGNRPNLTGLGPSTCADLLLTAGDLAGFLASTIHLRRGQIHAEELLNGAMALYEQLRLGRGVIESQIALAFCYQRQGLFDLARTTLMRVLEELSSYEDWNRDLRAFTLMRLGGLERNACHLKEALRSLTQATDLGESCGPWITPRCHVELASVYKDLVVSEGAEQYSDSSKEHYLKGIYQCSAVGHHRYLAATENNFGLLMLGQKCYEQSEKCFIRARNTFDVLSDSLRGAQSNETLARLYIETKQFSRANEVIDEAISILEIADGETILAEALTTKAIVCCCLEKFNDAQRSLEAAYRICERCEDDEGACLALVIMLEELGNRLEYQEIVRLAGKLKKLIGKTQQNGLRNRADVCISRYLSS